eukprot:Opistho-2@66949
MDGSISLDPVPEYTGINGVDPRTLTNKPIIAVYHVQEPEDAWNVSIMHLKCVSMIPCFWPLLPFVAPFMCTTAFNLQESAKVTMLILTTEEVILHIQDHPQCGVCCGNACKGGHRSVSLRYESITEVLLRPPNGEGDGLCCQPTFKYLGILSGSYSQVRLDTDANNRTQVRIVPEIEVWGLRESDQVRLKITEMQAKCRPQQPFIVGVPIVVQQPAIIQNPGYVVQPQVQYGQPQYGQPQYGQPQYGQPQYGQPQYGQPQYGQPQPQYGQPQPLAPPQTQSPAPSGKRVQVALAVNPVARKVVGVPSSMLEFRTAIAQKFGIESGKVKGIFTEGGAEVDDVNDIRDNDVLIVRE